MQTATYLVTREIALRSGMIDSRYRTADGRFVLNDRDLSRVRFTPDEYVSGLSGVEKITEAEVETLIRQNNYTLGDSLPESVETVEGGQSSEQEGETPTESAETPVEDNEPTIIEEEVKDE